MADDTVADAHEFAALAEGHGIVAAVVGISVGGVRHVVTHGVTGRDDGAPVERSTLFLAGSVTKAMTASLVALLVAEGRLDLDAPVRDHVPEFVLADPDALAAVTVRHLLTHTGGFDGDVWPDHGEGDEAVARFVASMGRLPQLAPPGRRFSYNNAGYSVLGRLVERIEGSSFDEVLRRRIAGPTGSTLTTAITDAEAERRAVGHLGTVPVDRLEGPACLAPAGSRTWASIDDLLAFGEWHLGRRADPHTAAALRAVRAPQIEVPDPNNGATMALGVFVDDHRWGTPVVFHDGGVAGQAAYLRILPDDDAVLALACTGGVPQTFHRHVFRWLARSVLARDAPMAARPDPSLRLDPDRYVGRFASLSTEVEVTARDGELEAVITWGGDVDQPVRTDRLPLSPVDPRVLLAPLDGRDYVLVYPPLDEPSDHLLAGLRLLVRR